MTYFKAKWGFLCNSSCCTGKLGRTPGAAQQSGRGRDFPGAQRPP